MSLLDDVAEDLEDSFLDDFATDATLDGQAVRVVFDEAGDVLGGMSVAAPLVQLRTQDVPAAYSGALLVITVGGELRNYSVQEHVPDGTGMSLLRLLRQA